MQAGHRRDEAETEAVARRAAFGLEPDEPLERLVAQPGRNTGATVPHLDDRPGAALAANDDAAAVRCVLDRVVHQIAQRLGEKLAARRILAVVAALVGAVIILRPGFREIGPGHYGMLIAAVFFAASYLIAKRMADETGAAVTVAMLSITVAIGLAPLALMNWVTPTWHELALLFGVAALATAGHYTMTLALAAAPVTVTQPVSFLQLVWAVLLGAFVFGEGLDPFVVLGGLIIIAAISFMTWREAVLKRRMRTPVVPATKF